MGSLSKRFARGVEIREFHPVEDMSASNRAYFEEAFEYAAVGTALVGLDGQCLRVNESLCDLFGYSEQELSSRTFQDITHPDDLEADLELVEKLLQGELRTYQMEKRYFDKRGNVVWVLLSVSLVRDGEGEPLYFISQVQDISERKALEAELTYLASHDHLTKLPNCASFSEQLERALASADSRRERLAILFLDLDGFKGVNDSFGHEMGDRLLAVAADRLSYCVRNGDTVARCGGDEFCVLVENIVNEEEAVQVAERILDCLQEPFAITSDLSPSLTASIGIVIRSPGEKRSAEQLVREADAAMYRAKSNGKARHEVFGAHPVLGSSRRNRDAFPIA